MVQQFEETTPHGPEFPGPDPGSVSGHVEGNLLLLENQALELQWEASNGLRLVKIVDKWAGRIYEAEKSEAFQLAIDESPLPADRMVTTADLRLVSEPHLQALSKNSEAVRAVERRDGFEISMKWLWPQADLEIMWQAQMRDGANYVRQFLTLRAQSENVPLSEVVLIDFPITGSAVCGQVSGSPAMAENLFFGYEHPLSESSAESNQLRCSYPHMGMLARGQTLVHSAVIGVVPEGQLRRGFLYYIERERARPYRPLLHHNIGEDAGVMDRYQLNRVWQETIEIYGKELIERRQVPVECFVHDYLWDDETLVWQFHESYPDGFTPARRLAEKYGATLGVWFSPWARTGTPSRVDHGLKYQFEANDHGLSTASPIYFRRFHTACINMMRMYGTNYYKFDGFGAGNEAAGGGRFRSDVESLLVTIEELRRLNPRVFINSSTGTWPSPFWLHFSDSVWRSDGDAGYEGLGSTRQQWITFRDGAIYHNICGRGPLYPLNSCMLHGIMVNSRARVEGDDVKDMTDEVRTFFGSGTQVQELYVDPRIFPDQMWDVLAEAAKWSRANANVLVDTHWVGGDPTRGEVYGWASWSKNKGILTLRNPDDQPAGITLDIGRVFELPVEGARRYSLSSPWEEDAGVSVIELAADKEHRFELDPLQVRVFDATPLP